MKTRIANAIIWIVLLFVVGAVMPARAAGQVSGSVSAEMVKGQLNPARSKVGDKLAVRLTEDLRSNGDVVLKKGTTINGVVRSVKQAEAKSKGGVQSMMEIEWLPPAGSGGASPNFNISLQSLSYTNPQFAHQQNEEAASLDRGLTTVRPAQQSAGTSSSRQGGLLGGVGASTSSATSSVTTIGGASTSSGPIQGAGAVGTGAARSVSTSGPTVVSADSGVASALHNDFGGSSNPLFVTGHGQVISASGSRESVDLYSHMSNDTVITSPGKNFEVLSGAQMQLLIGVK